VVGVADGERTYIYKNGVLKDCDKYRASAAGTCGAPTVEVIPRSGSAPVRIGTSNFGSFFEGSIRELRIWNRALTAADIAALFNGSISRAGLVAEHLLTSDLSPNSSGIGDAIVYAPWLP
jgi:hypothetical protein